MEGHRKHPIEQLDAINSHQHALVAASYHQDPMTLQVDASAKKDYEQEGHIQVPHHHGFQQLPYVGSQHMNEFYAYPPMENLNNQFVAQINRQQRQNDYQFSNKQDNSLPPFQVQASQRYDILPQGHLAKHEGASVIPLEEHKEAQQCEPQWQTPFLAYQPKKKNIKVAKNSPHSRNSSIGTTEFSKPKIATKVWDAENTICYQVKARGFFVSRREDTNFVNGTKLLNVIGMTRGKRDGILKAEKERKVVKVGPMNLKGVWIPFQRALEIARNEGVENLLYPLFIPDLKAYYLAEGHKLVSSTDEEQMDSGIESSPELKENARLLPKEVLDHDTFQSIVFEPNPAYQAFGR